MIKLGNTYVDPRDLQIVSFIGDATVQISFQTGGQLVVDNVPAEDVARFREVCDTLAELKPLGPGA